MKRNLKKLCAVVFLCAFACGISAAPVLAITVSGVVMTISKSGDDEIVDEATVQLFNRNGEQIAQTISDEVDGSFSITVEGDELVDVYFLTTKANFVDTYTQFFSFSEDEDEFEVPLLPAKETQDVIDSVQAIRPVIESMGIIAGGVEVLGDDDLTSVAGVKVKATDYDGTPILCNVLYLNLDAEDEPFWDPTLTETSATGVFALYNIQIPDTGDYRGVFLVLEGADPKYFFNTTDTIVFPYKAGVESPEKMSIANVLGWEPGAGPDIPIDDGGGGGGGCFVSGVLP